MRERTQDRKAHTDASYSSPSPADACLEYRAYIPDADPRSGEADRGAWPSAFDRLGEVLVEAGQRAVPFFVVAAGRLEVVRPSGTTETLVAVFGPGQFTGEVNMLSGRPALVRARASESGEVIQLDHERLWR